MLKRVKLAPRLALVFAQQFYKQLNILQVDVAVHVDVRFSLKFARPQQSDKGINIQQVNGSIEINICQQDAVVTTVDQLDRVVFPGIDFCVTIGCLCGKWNGDCLQLKNMPCSDLELILTESA